MLAQLRSLARMLFRRHTFEQSMADEMRFHMEAYAEDLMRRGISAEEARRLAGAEFGSLPGAQEECREARGVLAFDQLRQDLRYAIRQLTRTPAFTVAAVISLALGIGANSAIFSLMDAVLFRTLPLAAPDQLFYLAHGEGDDVSTSSNYPLLERYRASGLFAGVTAYSQTTFTVANPDGLERVDGQYASGNYHALLGAPVALGRGFSNEPDRTDGRAPVAVISDGYWTRRFGRDQNVLGRTISIDGRSITIIGVTAPGFHGLMPGTRVDITLPMSMRAESDPSFLTARDRWISLRLVARLRSGRTLAQTTPAAAELFRRYWSEPESQRRPGDVRLGALVPAGKGAADLRDRFGAPLRLLLGMVAIVLLVACANVANLSFARGLVRAREMAVRLSLGASRGRLVRQMLTESVLLALAGGALGVLVAALSTMLITSAFATGANPIVIDAAVSGRVLAFTAAMSLLTSVLVGLAPALRSSRVDVTPALKDKAALNRRVARWSIGRVLVIAQLALCVVVACTAALLARSVRNLRSLDTGFARERTVLFDVDAGSPSLTPELRAAFFAGLDARLRALPGVTAMAYTQRSPLDHSVQTRPVDVPGFPVKDGRRGVSATVVTPEFFTVFGMSLVRGRALSATDRPGTESAAVVDEAFVRAYFGAEDPIGRRLFLGADREPFTIVGVVRSARFENLRDEPQRAIYTALAQSRVGSRKQPGDARSMTVAVHTTQDPGALAAVVRGEVAALSRNVTVSYVRTMEQQMDAALLRERLMAQLSTSYGGLAVLLALVGLYGVTSFGVARRVHDIGIRMALGATRERMLAGILGETFATSTIGVVVGLLGAFAATRLVSSLLFGVAPRDPMTFGAIAALLSVTALVAGYVPARRAASIDPARALRSD